MLPNFWNLRIKILLSLFGQNLRDFNFSIIDSASQISVNFNFNDQNYSIDKTLLPDVEYLPQLRDLNASNWTHIALVKNEESTSLFINGEVQEADAEDFDDNEIPNLNISTTSVLFLDELKVFKFSLDEAAVRYLAGISFLDISGNKYHGTPMGVPLVGNDNAFLTKPDVNMSGADVPTADAPFPRSTYGTAILGDSFDGEDNGKSLSLDGNHYLDLSNHQREFSSLAEGTIVSG